MEGEVIKFTKYQILTSNIFSGIEKDTLKFILEDNMTYSLNEVNEILNDLKKRRVD